MGGVRLSEAENVVRNATATVAFWGGCTFPVWFIIACVYFFISPRPRWQAAWPPRDDAAVSPPLKAVALASILVWVFVLPFTQPEQMLRRRVESAFREGRIADGVATLSAHGPDDFPPQWSPPPNYLRGEPTQWLFDVWKVLLHEEPAPWVRGYYLEQLKHSAMHARWNTVLIAHVLTELPEGGAVVDEIARDPNGEWMLERLRSHLRPELRRKN
jgi:hypothetical protein